MRKTTYGENLSRFDRRDDESYWNRRFQNALKANDFSELESLIKEALDEDYYIPYYQEPQIQEILKRLGG